MVEWTMFTGQADVLFTSYVPLRATPALLPGGHPLRRRRDPRDRNLLRHARRGEARADLHRLGAARHVRRDSPPRSSPPLRWRTARRSTSRRSCGRSGTWMNVDPSGLPAGVVGPRVTRRSRSTWPRWSRSGICSAPSRCGAVVVNEKISRTAFVLYIAFISMASAHHLLVDPGFRSFVEDREHLVLHVHGGARFHAARLHGPRRRSRWACGCAAHTQGIFGWLRRAPMERSGVQFARALRNRSSGSWVGSRVSRSAPNRSTSWPTTRLRIPGPLSCDSGLGYGNGLHGHHLLRDSAHLP